jgi:hypothetical protein
MKTKKSLESIENNFFHKPIRVFSRPLNQDTSAGGLA